MREVALIVNGTEYKGWKSIQIVNSIESVSGSFSMSVSERWNGQSKPWPIREEDECIVKIGSDPVITGYVDNRNMFLDDSQHSFEVTGRDKVADIIDCSVVLDQWEFLNITTLELCKKVCSPFGIDVKLGQGVSLPVAPPRVVINPGETVFEVVDRACKLASLFPVSDGKGGLLLTKAGTVAASNALVEDKNIKSISAEYDCSSCYSKYIVIGQQQGTDEIFGTAAADVRAEAQDANVTRTARVLMIQAEGGVTIDQAQKRANWEASVRRARALTVLVTVQGWEQSDGKLWVCNSNVQVDAPYIGIQGSMLISEVTYNLSDQGSSTQLRLRLPAAFEPMPEIPKNPEDSIMDFEETE